MQTFLAVAALALTLGTWSGQGSQIQQVNSQGPSETPIKAGRLSFLLSGKHPPVWSKSTKYFLESRVIDSNEEEYVAFISDNQGRVLMRHKYDAGIDGAWSEKQDALFMNDRLGSTQIDCLVWTSTRSNELISLTSLAEKRFIGVNGSARHLLASERPGKARFALTCDGWSGLDIKASLDGETWSGRPFSCKFLYDIGGHTLKQAP